MEGVKIYEEYIQLSQQEIADVGTAILRKQSELGKSAVVKPTN